MDPRQTPAASVAEASAGAVGPPHRPAPKLAVVISCYNYEAYVGEAIASVQAQQRPDCELVVVDDGSTDGSWAVIARAGVRAYRIANGGQAAACLHGLDRTRAPFVLFLDADDALKPGALDVLMGRLDPELAKLQFGLTPMDARGRPRPTAVAALETFRGREALIDRVVRNGVYKTPPTSGNVFRRDVCELLREVDYDRAVDGVILFAAPLFGDVLSLADELGLYRVHDRNDSGAGGLPRAATLERDLARFVARTRHLGEIVRRMTGRELIDARDAFYYQERKLYLDIVSRRRPALAQMRRLLAAALRQDGFSWPAKVSLIAFLLTLAILPSDPALTVLSYRLQAGRRSAFEFVRRAFMRQAAAGS